MVERFSLYEAPSKKIVFAFGRFNPPTTGHEKLIKAVARISGRDEFRIYPSFSQNPKKDPLPHALKIAYMRKMFPKYAKNILADKTATTFINVAVKLYDEGFTDLVMVAGSDRVKEFETLLQKYNGVEGKRHGYFKFDSIDVVSAGERDPDAEGVEGMSASKMRAAATENRYKNEYDERGNIKKAGFESGLPKGFSDGRKLFSDVRKYMGIREEKDMGPMDEYEELRDRYLTGKIWNIGEHIEANGIEGRIVSRGTNYISFNDSDGKVHKAWLHEVRQDPDVKDKKGTQPAKYYAGDMKKSTKAARDAHFKKGAKMDDDNPAAYKPAPGDSTAKTKPSQYTKKYKQMFGERAKQAVSGGKVQKLVTAHGLKFKGKAYKEIDMELVGIDNSSQMVTFNIIHPKEIFGNEIKIPFRTLRRGPFMATDTSKINERELTPAEKDKLKDYEKKIDMKDFIDRYGEKEGKSIYYATLTKMAKNEDFDEDLASYVKAIGKGKKKTSALDDYMSMKDRLRKKKSVKMQKNEFGEDLELDEKIEGLAKKSEKSGISYSILKKVYDRGMAAWRTGHRPGTTPQQWAFARVNSFITGGKTRTTADADLWKKHRSEAYEMGVDYGTHTREVTPLEKPLEKKRVNKEEIEKWYSDISVHERYEDRYGDDWYLKLTETYNKLLEKVSCCEECSEEEQESVLIEENVYRVGSEKYFEFFREKRTEYYKGNYHAEGFDKTLMEGDIGKYAMYEGNPVPLDCPMVEEDENVELNKPQRGGPKKFYVYVKNPKTGNIKKVTFGDTTGLKVKLDDKEARKSFAARHDCKNQKDRTTAAYWSCNLPRYAKQLGLSGGGNFFW